jgi:hypothetical protein
MFSPQFFKESLSNVGVIPFDCDLAAHIFPQFRTWLDDRALPRLYLPKTWISDALRSPS